jgi:hypothetical protein
VAIARMITPKSTSEMPNSSVMEIAACESTYPDRAMAKKPRKR